MGVCRFLATAATLLLLLTLSPPLSTAAPATPLCATLPPHSTCSVVAFGAAGNGVALDTKPIRAALACPSCDTVVFDDGGTFLTGAFNVSSHTRLIVPHGTTIVADTRLDSYPLVDALPTYPLNAGHNSQPRFQALISGYGAVNVTLAGAGVIDGQGKAWWDAHKAGKLPHQRPPLVEFLNGADLTITGLTLLNSPYYHIHPYRMAGVTIASVTIDAPLGSPNTDGIDPDSCSDVLIASCEISSGDDHISLKAGKAWEGYEAAVPTTGVVIRDSIFHHGAGIAVGSETSGGIENVLISNVHMDASDNLVRFKTCPTYGRGIRNVTYDGAKGAAIVTAVFVDMAYECGPPNTTLPAPSFDHVSLRNFDLTAVARAGSIRCLPGGACSDWSLDSLTLHSLEGWDIAPGAGLTNATVAHVHPSFP